MINFCDKCGEENQVKLFSIGSGGNLILCQECMHHENVWRRQRNRELPEYNHYNMMLWAQGKELT
jgi:hypothetical protein